MDRKDLKIQALVEKISELTSNYENQAADYRVEITVLSQEVQSLQKQLDESKDTDVSEEDKDPFED